MDLNDRERELIMATAAQAIAESELPRVMRERDMLLAACRILVNCADIAAEYWDQDQDSKVGKFLRAMSGNLKGYRGDIDKAHQAIALCESSNHTGDPCPTPTQTDLQPKSST